MWFQPSLPTSNLLLSTLIALLPILVLAGLLLSRKVPGHVAALSALLTAILLTLTFYHMPARLVTAATCYGIAVGLLPIGWIVLTAVFLYNLSVASGGFAVVRSSVESLTQDRRLQALLIAFCFGAFLEGCAGFGAPVAITAGMLVGMGFRPLSAATLCLLANTAPVAFGAVGIAIVTAGRVTNIDPALISRMIAHQLPLIAFIIPLWLTLIIAGVRQAWKIWPAILVTGASYSITMFLTATFLGPSLPDILSGVVSIASLIVLLHFWQPDKVWRFPKDTPLTKPKRLPAITVIRAWTPFLLLIAFIGNWALPGLQSLLAKTNLPLHAFALNDIIVGGHPLNVTYAVTWLSATGTAILLAALTSAVILRLPAKMVLQTAEKTLSELSKPLITIGSIVGFAYLVNYSGMASTLALTLSHTGPLFPLLSPLLGWLGVFITGSDTSSNALFGTVQQQTAASLHLNPVLTVSANSSGGVAAKMISPQSIAVATAATGLTGQEGALFRRAVGHSLGIVAIICLLTYAQAYLFPWMIPHSQGAATTTAARFHTPDLIILVITAVFLLALTLVADLQPPRRQTVKKPTAKATA